MSTTNPTAPTVYFDGECPVCSREIAMYRRQAGAEAMNWVDVAHCQPSDMGAGLSRDDALARLHLRRADGSLVSGARAFTQMWKALPRWAWLGKLMETAPGLWLLEAAYRAFLWLRPFWRRA